jgi:hypothetical protein
METKRENTETPNMEPAKTETKTLYQMSSVVPRFKYRGRVFKNVEIIWWVKRDQDQPPLPYEQIILNYEPPYGKPYQCSCVDELFTKSQATALQAYLLATHNDNATIEEITLPIDCEGMTGVSAFPAGETSDFIELSEEPEYNLDFRVAGFFSVRGCECIEEAERPQDHLAGKAMLRRIDAAASIIEGQLAGLRAFAENIAEGLSFEIGDRPGRVPASCDICQHAETPDLHCIRIAGFTYGSSFLCSDCAKTFAPELFARLPTENKKVFEQEHGNDPDFAEHKQNDPAMVHVQEDKCPF